MTVSVSVHALFYGVLFELNRTDMTQQRWTKFLALLDHMGRYYYDLPGVPSMDDISEGIAIDAMTEAVADAISDSVAGLEEVLRALRVVVQPTEVVSEPGENYSADHSSEPVEEVDAEGFTQRERQQRLLDALRDAQQAADARDAAEAAAEPVEPDVAPTVAPVAAPAPVDEPTPEQNGAERPLSLHQQRQVDAIRAAGGNQSAAAAQMGLDVKIVGATVSYLRQQHRLPVDVEAAIGRFKAARKASPVSGQMQKVHDAQESERAAIREVAQRSLTSGVDESRAAAAEFAAKRNAAAKRKADETWAERHPGEVRA